MWSVYHIMYVESNVRKKYDGKMSQIMYFMNIFEVIKILPSITTRM